MKRLPLHGLHVKKSAHFGCFGEWEVPLYYTSILEEHEAVRTQAGLFDISHMGKFFVRGGQAKRFLDVLIPRRMERLRDGKALYGLFLNEGGGIVDDLIVYQLAGDHFLLIVNAACTEKDFHWIQSKSLQGVELDNATENHVLFALQGHQSLEIVKALFHCDFQGVGYYHFLQLESNGDEVLVARTGYTGEEGVEILTPLSKARSIWEALLEEGKGLGLKPVGFGARDTLRLEAGMLLYGQDMDEATSPLEAGLEWTIDWEKSHFLGREALLRQKKEGIRRKLVGFEMVERGIPRHGFKIEKNGLLLGEVTSGSFAPTLKKNIGLGYVPVACSKVDSEFEIVIRSQKVKAKVIPLPFYRRERK